MINTVATQAIADQIVMLERAALDRWGKGDPGGFLNCMRPTSPISIR